MGRNRAREIGIGVCGTPGCTDPDCAIKGGTCHCGCLRTVTIADDTDTARSQIKGYPSLYVVGHNPKTISPFATEKRCPSCGEVKPMDAFVSDRSKPTGRASYCRACMGEQYLRYSDLTEGNYRTVHRTVERARPKTGVCEACGRARREGERAFDLAYLGYPPYTEDPNDYAELCKSCHGKLDNGGGSLIRKIVRARIEEGRAEG